MKTVGIVAEYNPFHAGHRYHIEQSRRIAAGGSAEPCAVIVAMSGDFVQRGEPAIYDKFTRAEAALQGGADLVLELPLCVSLASAEGFAAGAVRLLSGFHPDHLSFGSETAELRKLTEIAGLFLGAGFTEQVKLELKQHPEQSFPAARQTVAESLLGRPLPELRQPNNILAVEYLKALHGTGIRPIAVRRVGAGHDDPGENEYPSASALRETLRAQGIGPNPALTEALILDRLRRCEREDFPMDGLGDRLFRAVRAESNYEGILRTSASRRYPLARVRRSCMRAILQVPEDGMPEYVRVLAANGLGRTLLRSYECIRDGDVSVCVPDNSELSVYGSRIPVGSPCTGKSTPSPLPLLTKPAHARSLSKAAQEQFALGSRAHDLYRLLHGDGTAGADWRKSPILVN